MPSSSVSSLSSSSSSSSPWDARSSSSRRRRRDEARPKMPLTSIPDMRFEQSFLASVRGFIHEVKSNEAALAIKREHVEGEEEEAEAEAEGEKGARTKKQAPAEDPLVDDTLGAGLHPIHGREPREDEAAHTVVASHAPTGEPELWIGRLRIEWWSIAYLTLRDQLLSPIIQGAVFGMGGLALGHVRTFLGARRQQQRVAAAAAPTPPPRFRRSAR